MEKKTDRIQIKIQPSIKAAAQELAAKEGRTLSNYIVNLLQTEIIKRRENDGYITGYCLKYETDVKTENSCICCNIKQAKEFIAEIREEEKENNPRKFKVYDAYGFDRECLEEPLLIYEEE